MPLEPTLVGTIGRRILLTFRADPDAVQRLLPEPFEVIVRYGHAAVGLCLIRLEGERVKGLPVPVGLTAENMAHRIAALAPSPEGPRPVVYIPRRDTGHPLVALAGGRILPVRQHHARFHVRDDGSRLRVEVETEGGHADVELEVEVAPQWPGSRLFDSLADAIEFFREGDCGYSPPEEGGVADGVRLCAADWSAQPLRVVRARSAWFEARLGERLEPDCALLMRNVAHEWRPAPPVRACGAVPAGSLVPA